MNKIINKRISVEGTTQETFSYDGLSRMTQAVNDYSTVNMSYDSMGNLLNDQQQIGSQSAKSVQSAYDNMSFRTSLTYPNSRQITFVSDDLSRLYQIKNSSLNVIAEYTYAGPGRVTGRSYLNGTNLTVTYDGGKRATGYSHGGIIGNFNYAFDKENNKKYEKRSHDTKGDAYRYDALYQLTGVKHGVPNNDLNPSTPYENYTTFDSQEQFGLDGVGNRISVTNTSTINYTTNELNQYTEISGTNLAYDLNGNLISDSVKTYIYDYSNRLLKVINGTATIAEYQYDVFGRRITKILLLTTKYYYYDGARCIEERNSSDIVVKSYVYGNGIDEVLTVEQDSNTYYYHENSLGSIYAVTDNTGVVVERYKYTIYGRCTFFEPDGVTERTESIIGNRLLFTGREYDVESGLYYYRARYYSPELGRFLQRDIKEDDNLKNLYTYVNNNPINNTDPFGWKKKEATSGMSASQPFAYGGGVCLTSAVLTEGKLGLYTISCDYSAIYNCTLTWDEWKFFPFTVHCHYYCKLAGWVQIPFGCPPPPEFIYL